MEEEEQQPKQEQEQEQQDRQQRQRWQRLSSAFEAALTLPPDERRQLLDSVFGTTGVTRDEVEAMLAASDRGGTLQIERLLRDAAAVAAGGASLAVGTRIGPWCVEALQGAGGMGEVYRAQRVDGAFDQRVAIKVMRMPRGAGAEDRTRRFESERRILARLEHPDIVAIIDGGWLADGRPYFVMPFVEGRSFLDYCETHSLPTDARIALLVGVARAVGYAHAREIVHRDLKPSNVLVGNNGRPRLLDFGIAKLLTDDLAVQTHTGALLLTPHYAAPEQLRGAPVSPAADVYALGVMLSELLSAAQPGPRNVADHSLAQEAGRIARRALDPDPSRRYRDADDLADILACVLDRFHAAGEGRGRTSGWRWSFVPRRLAAGGVAAALTIGSAALVTLRAARHDGNDAVTGATVAAPAPAADSASLRTRTLAGASREAPESATAPNVTPIAAPKDAPSIASDASASPPPGARPSGAGVKRGALAPEPPPNATTHARRPGKARDLQHLALVYGSRGLNTPAIALMDSVVDRVSASEGSTSVEAAYARAQRGLLRVQIGALDGAARDLALADSVLRGALPASDTLLADVDLFTGTLELWRARPDSALLRFQASHTARALSGGAHPKRAAAACGIGLALTALNRQAESDRWQTFCSRQRRWARGYDAMVKLMQGAARRDGSAP